MKHTEKRNADKKAKGAIPRLVKLLFSEYRKQLILVFVCIILTAIASTIASFFMNLFINLIDEGLDLGWDAVKIRVFTAIGIMIAIYAVGIVAAFVNTRTMAIVTQSFMNKMRKRMFDKMQSLPLRYFDTHPHGDVMSYYTNDIDTLRELISRTIPQIMSSALILSFLIFLI